MRYWYMSKKKNKENVFDEYFSNGQFEVGRIGNIVSMKNHLTKEDVEKRNIELAERYDETKAEIENQIAEIARDIKKCDPLSLLLAATDREMMNMINVVSEIQIQGQQNFELRAVEYIQSILVSQKPEIISEDEQEELIQKVLKEIDKLYMDIIPFYFCWAAKTSVENEDLTDSDIRYIVEAQFMGNVRGKRYQFQQLTNIEKLLLPHSKKMQEVYGITAEELLSGLKKLEHSLSSGKLDSMKNMFEEFLQFQKEAKGKSSKEVEELLEQISESQQNIQNCGQCFGTDLYNVKKVTGWSDKLIDSLSWQLGECEDFSSNGEFARWPIINLPVQKRPFIKIDGVSYCFDYYNLFDNIYRIIQKDIKRHDDKYTTKWADLQQIASEALVEEQFKKLLPGCKSYVGNYYPQGQSLKQMDENDILILYDDTLIIVEVKAGSFTYTPAIVDYAAHKKSFDALVGKADYQCERTLRYIKNSQEIIFYEGEKSKKPKFVIDKEKYENIYTFCVTVENFNVFEAKIEKTNFFQVSSGTIAISIDDLEVYTEYFKSPLYFLHYLGHRRAATNIKSLMLSDELDHLGMYIVHNAYDIYADEFKECDSFVANGYREDLDAYFAGLHCSEVKCEKPEQEIPGLLRDIITYIEKERLSNRVSFANFLLDLHPDDRKKLADDIFALYQRQAEIHRMCPAIYTGDALMYGCFIAQDDIKLLDENYRLKYMYANMLKLNKSSCWYIVLEFNKEFGLNNIYYRELFIEDIEKGYDKNELVQFAEVIFQNRVKTILAKEHKKKIYPNDLCPCGSGKKYKKCCGKN